jgi:hypothetical protein
VGGDGSQPFDGWRGCIGTFTGEFGFAAGGKQGGGFAQLSRPRYAFANLGHPYRFVMRTAVSPVVVSVRDGYRNLVGSDQPLD